MISKYVNIISKGKKDKLAEKKLHRYISQRNELSRRLNEMSQLAAKKSCEVKKLKKPSPKQTHVSLTGGWCEQTNPKIIQERAAHDLTYAMSAFLKGKRVGSFGDGPGSYKYAFDKDNKVALYDGMNFFTGILDEVGLFALYLCRISLGKILYHFKYIFLEILVHPAS